MQTLAAYAIEAVKGTNLFTLPERLFAPSGYMIYIQTNDTNFLMNSTEADQYSDFYFNSTTDLFTPFLDWSVNFLVYADYAINTVSGTFSGTFNHSGDCKVEVSICSTNMEAITTVKIFPSEQLNKKLIFFI